MTNNINSKRESVIFLKNNACLGTCPIYSIEIFNNGEGIYHGIRFVNNIGKLKFQVSNSDIKKILDFTEEIKFQFIHNKSSSLIQDLPTTILRIKNKKISINVESPKELIELKELINTVYKKSI